MSKPFEKNQSQQTNKEIPLEAQPRQNKNRKKSPYLIININKLALFLYNPILQRYNKITIILILNRDISNKMI